MFTSQKKKKKLKIHVGAHKTATTHFQDTLEAMLPDLQNNDIRYFPRDLFREQIAKCSSNRELSKFFLTYSKNKFISKTLHFSDYQEGTILISEENLLGPVLDSISIFPYQGINPQFLKLLSGRYDLNIFLTIRSLEKVWPGSYVTGLRFSPARAIEERKKILFDLESGKKASWVPLIEKLVKSVPKAKVNICFYENYQDDYQNVIKKFIGLDSIKVPEIENPASTSTPSFYAVHEIEKLVPNFSVGSKDVWNEKISKIIVDNQPQNKSEKYSFINETWSSILNDWYKDDCEFINNRYGDMVEWLS